jgi:hypothetical protein
MTPSEKTFLVRQPFPIEETLNDLLEHACPAIRYRLRRELLNQSQMSAEMLALQNRILEDQTVKEVLSWQQPDGWIAWNFHGYHSMEAGIRILCEKGLDASHPALAKALLSLEKETGRLERGFGKVGAILDKLGLGGTELVRAALLAQAGVENAPCLQDQIHIVLAAFRTVLSIDTIEDLVEEYKGKLVFRAGVQWPSIYHLRLLAWTHGWRSPYNQDMIAASLERLVKLSPLPAIGVRHKSQLIAPASFGMHDFKADLTALNDTGWMMWFQRMELLARLGVIHQVPELKKQAATLYEILEAGGGKFDLPLKHTYFRQWGAYTGLMLEADWKDPRRRIYDLTFRSLLILILGVGNNDQN